MAIELLVTDILRTSLNDGPGIRTTVFLKGCPLRCAWCHNPETQSGKVQAWFDDTRCSLCGKCVEACRSGVHEIASGQHRVRYSQCTACGECVRVCPQSAMRLIGTYYSPEKIMEIVIRDKPFYDRSGGGITISGGEPMSQFAGTIELLKLAKEGGIHTCLDTCGQASLAHYRELMPYVDLFLWDFKATGEELHRELTGVDGKLIRANLDALYAAGAKIRLRCPMVPGVNDSPEHMRAIATLSHAMPDLDGIDLMAYHPFGKSKAKRVGMSRSQEKMPETNADDAHVARWLQTLSSLGCTRATAG